MAPTRLRRLAMQHLLALTARLAGMMKADLTTAGLTMTTSLAMKVRTSCSNVQRKLDVEWQREKEESGVHAPCGMNFASVDAILCDNTWRNLVHFGQMVE